jgi:MCM P-loop domain
MRTVTLADIRNHNIDYYANTVTDCAHCTFGHCCMLLLYCSLLCRCAMYYTKQQSAAENIDLMTTILSRFDLIFVVRDIRYVRLVTQYYVHGKFVQVLTCIVCTCCKAQWYF